MTLNKIEGANRGMELEQQLYLAELKREVVELHDFALRVLKIWCNQYFFSYCGRFLMTAAEKLSA